MALTAAQLLDELMGKDRNLVPGEKSAQVHWSHPDCCKNFLCGFCPHDLFVNTKADLGPCAKVHDDQLKADYDKSSRYGRVGYEEDFIHFLSSIQSDVERKIRRGHERLLMNKAREQELSQDDNDKTKMLTDHINQLLDEIEQLGSEGKVEEAQGVAKLVEQLKEEREQSKANAGTAGQEKQMEVCEVCGAFLIVGDAQSRVDDHLQGKQHVGYAKIKSTLEDMKNKSWLKKRKESTEQDKGEQKKDERDRRSDRDSERDRRRRSRSRSREKRRERRRSRDRSDRDRSDKRDRDRDRRRSSRERESRRSHRSRSRSPKERSRRRSRSKDRDDKRRRDSRDRKDGLRSRDRSEAKDDRQSREVSETKDKSTRDDIQKDGGRTNGESGHMIDERSEPASGSEKEKPTEDTKSEEMETNEDENQ